MHTHYQLLQVKEAASFEEIRRAYRHLVLKYHPDRHLGVENKLLHDEIIKINEAYSILSNPSSRALYDFDLQSMRRLYTQPLNSQPVKTTYSNAGIDFRYIFYAAAIILYALVHLSKSYIASVESTQSTSPKEVTPDISMKEVFKPQVKNAVESIYYKK